MKSIKRIFLVTLLLLGSGLLFRGWIYRRLVTYKSIGSRDVYSVKNKKLVNYINTNADYRRGDDIKQVIEAGLLITAKQLNFTAGKNNLDPNKLIESKSAHCVGYAAFFATTCNYILAKHHLADTWIAKPQIGQLYVLGTNVHRYFDSAFFKDHDFVTIKNRSTGEVYAVDPTVNDYLGIDFVSYNKNEARR